MFTFCQNEPDDAANTLQEAFKSYKKSDPEDAARVLQQASGSHSAFAILDVV